MTDSAQPGLPAQEPAPLPDLAQLVQTGEWRRALAVSRLTPTPLEVQEALSSVVGVLEALRARRYPAARKHLAEYQALVQNAVAQAGELSVIRRQLDPQALAQALAALNDSLKEGDAAVLAANLAPALELPLTRAEALNLQGVLSALQGDSGRARGLFAEAVSADPGHYRALTNIGNLDLEAGNFAQAEATYREVIKLNPEYDGAHHNLGVALRRQGKIADSVGAIRRGQKLSLKRSRDDSDAEMKEQFGSSNTLKYVRWAVFAVIALALFLAVRGMGG